MGQKCGDFEKELYCRIDEVVHYLWDPIGISSHPDARDEYFAYLPEIYNYVMSGDFQSLENYLVSISTDHMGLGDNLDSIKSVIAVMFDWKMNLEQKHAANRV